MGDSACQSESPRLTDPYGWQERLPNPKDQSTTPSGAPGKEGAPAASSNPSEGQVRLPLAGPVGAPLKLLLELEFLPGRARQVLVP